MNTSDAITNAINDAIANTALKFVPCKECGVEVPVNAAYPISQVECRPHYCPTGGKKIT
jgi:hypothetical protein